MKWNEGNEQEQYKILANAIHPIRLLQLTNDSEFGNYLGYDSETYKRICQIFPVFAEIDIYFNSLNQLIKSLKLDSKEFVLYSAILEFSSSKYFLIAFSGVDQYVNSEDYL